MFKRGITAALVAAWLVGQSAAASQLEVAFELPNIDSADYQRPYVAIWRESKGGHETLLLWHLKRKDEDKWLPDIRRWWRKLGRYGEAPDAVTGATRGPGQYRESFQLADSSPFTLLLEVVREDGGRSLIKQPIDFSSGEGVFELPAGEEIGPITITLGSSQ